jgi:hypothetical protein
MSYICQGKWGIYEKFDEPLQPEHTNMYNVNILQAWLKYHEHSKYKLQKGLSEEWRMESSAPVTSEVPGSKAWQTRSCEREGDSLTAYVFRGHFRQLILRQKLLSQHYLISHQYILE